MFIKSNVSTVIKDKDRSFKIPYQYVGNVPDWVRENWYFKSLCQNGDIMFLENKLDSTLEKADKQAQEIKTHKEEVAEQQREMDAIVNEATQQAEEAAQQQGLDEVSKKNFIKQEVEKAVTKKTKGK